MTGVSAIFSLFFRQSLSLNPQLASLAELSLGIFLWLPPSIPALELEIPSSFPSFFEGVGDSNSCFHACAAKILHTELPLTPSKLGNEKNAKEFSERQYKSS